MTAALGRVARSSPNNRTPIPLSIEGPYTSRFPHSLSEYDRILLVAGGIGSTFIIPLYRSITSENPQAKITVIWAVQTAGDATWAFTVYPNILSDDNVQVFVTGQSGPTPDEGRGSGSDVEGIEGTEMNNMYRRRGGKFTTEHNRKRPDLGKIVDGVFRGLGEGEKVGVAVCGPEGMARDLRAEVGRWVYRGREVGWWKEGFGF